MHKDKNSEKYKEWKQRKVIAVQKWRVENKRRIVKAMGGKCQICGYDRCNDALELHHINPEEKEYGFGGIRANPKAIKSIIPELKKCVLLCSNCHKELHAELICLPDNYFSLNEELLFD